MFTIRMPHPYVIQRAVEYVYKLRFQVITPESNVWGSHYAVFAVALLLATKVLDDARHSLSKWSTVTTIPQRTLFSMEMEFIRMLDWRL